MVPGDSERNPAVMSLLGHPRGMLDSFAKEAGVRCPHQCRDGCRVYEDRPASCRLWNCRWLVSNDTGELHRPDRVGYVIDMMPDYLRVVPNDGSNPEGTPVQVVQIWIDPKRPDAWRKDKAFRAYLERRGAEGIGAILRYSEARALIVIAPAIAADGQWHEVGDATLMKERSTWPGQTMEPRL